MSENDSKPDHSINNGLDLNKANLWKDWLYKLQTGSSTLPGESKENSSDLGIYGHNIILNTLHCLREERIDDRGKPYILLNDEVSDEEVLTNASDTERRKFFVTGIVRTAKEFWIGATEDRLKSFVVSSIAVGSAITGDSPEKIKDLLIKEVPQTNWRTVQVKNLFLDQIRKSNPNRIREMLKYLEFSQTQMTLEEEHALVRKFEPKRELGSEPIDIGGQEYGFVGSSNPGWLSKEELDQLTPMRQALRISRKEIVRQAKELAKKLFNTPEGKIYNPPKWWVEGEDLRGLKSTDGLLFIPHLDEIAKENAPDYIKEIYGLYGRGGWFHLEINEKDYERPVILQAGKLSS